MNTRDIAKLQYEKGQQIKATDVNDQMKAAFTRFNDMGPTDTLPLTTGQFRVFEPTIGFKLKSELTTANNWVAANGAAASAVSFVCPITGDRRWYIVANGAGAALALLTVGHRYTAYMRFSTAGAGSTSTVGMWNGIITTGTPIASRSGGATAGINIFGTFVATDTRFCVGGYWTAGANPVTVTLLNQSQFDTADVAVYIYDWEENEWLIPNYCGFMHPATFGIVLTGERREQHALMCQAIKKEIDAANEVLSYL